MKLSAATVVNADLDRLWHATQDPDLHARWDLRFSRIEFTPQQTDGAPRRFTYERRLLPGMTVRGWGETAASREGRSSALRFGSSDPRSPIVEGAGSWTYLPVQGGVHFSTTYDYRPRYRAAGRLFDRLVFRPAMVWATRWSFDRLRLWLERGTPPELTWRLWLLRAAVLALLGSVWVLEGLLPKLLLVRPEEVELVRRSGLWLQSPLATLNALGVLEVLLGAWLLSGRAARAAVLLASALTLAFTVLVLSLDAAALSDPYGGIVKNLGLIAAGLAVWVLEPHVPHAHRARPRASVTGYSGTREATP